MEGYGNLVLPSVKMCVDLFGNDSLKGERLRLRVQFTVKSE